MAKQIINIGTGSNTGNGDDLRDSMIKINQNFNELYDLVADDINDLSDSEALLKIKPYIELTNDIALRPSPVFSNDVVNYSVAIYTSPAHIVSTFVEIKRDSLGFLYNSVAEALSNLNVSPTGTLWNLDGWDDLSDVTSRIYTPLNSYFDGNYTYITNKKFVMYDIAAKEYHTIRFLSFESSISGGGFSLERRKINTSYWFQKTSSIVAEGIALNDQLSLSILGGVLYNKQVETTPNYINSPVGTLWNLDGWNDLSDVSLRTYSTFSSLFPIDYSKANNYELVMRDTVNSLYYLVKFKNIDSSLDSFELVIFEIDTTKKKQGIKFSDGTIQKTASNKKTSSNNENYVKHFSGYSNFGFSGGEKHSYPVFTAVNEGAGLNTVYVNSNDFLDLKTALQFGASYFDITINSTLYRNVFGFINFSDKIVFTFPTDIIYTPGSSLLAEYREQSNKVKWLELNEENCSGAIIEYSCKSKISGTVIGTLLLAKGLGIIESDILKRTEAKNGNASIEFLSLWDLNGTSNSFYVSRSDNEPDNIKIQWTGKSFHSKDFD